MKIFDIIIIGGGPAGLSAAIRAYEKGIRNMLIIERNYALGGILNQCIHNGFGLHIFKEELTGPEYADRLVSKVCEYDIACYLESMVLDITNDKIVKVLSKNGVEMLKGKTIILAMGCREKPRGAINIPGERCAGIFSAGTAQELVNLKGYDIGKEIVILGSGDIGLIMARRLTFEGAKVKCVVELMPYSSGLKRNVVQCLEDYSIPLKFNSTITNIFGKERVEAVTIAEVDENRTPIKSTEETISCDTILLSVGLIPENELTKCANIDISKVTGGAIVDSSMQTSVDGIFACGNVLHVHDLVDNVTLEAFDATDSAVLYLENKQVEKNMLPIVPDFGVRYTIPNFFDTNKQCEFMDIKFRSDNVYNKAIVEVCFDGEVVISRKRKIVTPGEMEKIKINAELLEKAKTCKVISVRIGVGL